MARSDLFYASGPSGWSSTWYIHDSHNTPWQKNISGTDDFHLVVYLERTLEPWTICPSLGRIKLSSDGTEKYWHMIEMFQAPEKLCCLAHLREALLLLMLEGNASSLAQHGPPHPRFLISQYDSQTSISLGIKNLYEHCIPTRVILGFQKLTPSLSII
jgi:hypothetical protein